MGNREPLRTQNSFLSYPGLRFAPMWAVAFPTFWVFWTCSLSLEKAKYYSLGWSEAQAWVT